jgi:hypothetical protein
MGEILTPQKLEQAFAALRRVLPRGQPRAPKQFYALGDLQAAFRALKQPLATAKERGGLINPWSLASLGHDEVRNAAALAGLWMAELGGEASKRFLANYLSAAIPGSNWIGELAAGYRVGTEVCPMGDAADRVDIVVETARYLIGVEVKIGAGLGRKQLERYSASISRRAKLQNLRPRVVLLAPFRAALSDVSSSSWSDVARAAEAAAASGAGDRTFVQLLIASFGDHVRAF